MRSLKYYLPGSILILMALLIVAVPEILIALAAASMIMLGVGVLYLGHLLRKSEQERDVLDGSDDIYGWNFVKSPWVRWWYRGF